MKGSRFITHTKRLRDVRLPLANFLASGLLNLGAKMGPLLWQLPPTLRFDPALIADFLSLLPKDMQAAAALARTHDARVDGRATVDIDTNRPLRHAMEIRHGSFRTPAFVELLREHGVALVCADTVKWPRLMDLTADFAYCRLHGSTELYRSRYSDDHLSLWARRIAAWAEGRAAPDGDFAGAPAKDHRRREVFVFFDNTDKRHAPEDAGRLMEMLGLRWQAGEEAAG